MMLRPILKYPGSKWRLRDEIYRYIPSGIDTIISPFFGSGAFEIHCYNQGLNVIGYDICEDLINFWNHCTSEDFIDRIADHEGIISSYFDTVKERYIYKPGIESAVDFYLLSWLSYAGILVRKGGGKDIRSSYRDVSIINQTSIRRLENFSHIDRNRFVVNRQSWEQTLMTKIDDCIYYLDPPYIGYDDLYGFSKNEPMNHIDLFDRLYSLDGWILSYGKHHDILEMYEDFTIVPIQSSQKTPGIGGYKSRQAKQILILSHDIAERISE